MALEALADVLSNLGQRYQNKIEDEQKRAEHLSDVADERSWLEGRTANEQNFQDTQRQKHVADEKDVRKYSSDLSLVEQKERIKSEIEGHIQEVNALAPLERAKKLYNDGIVNSIEDGKSISAEAATQAYLAKAAQAETSELTTKLKNLPTEFLIDDARNAPVRASLEASRAAVQKQAEETNRQITEAQAGSDSSDVLDQLARKQLAGVTITPDLAKKLKKANISLGQLKALAPIDQLNTLSTIDGSGIGPDTVGRLNTQATNIAKSNQANAATLARALPGYQSSIEQLNLHIASMAQKTPPPPQAAPIVGAPSQDTSSFFQPGTAQPVVGDNLPWNKPMVDTSFAMPTSAVQSLPTPAPSNAGLSMYFNPGATPSAPAPVAAPMPVVNSVAPAAPIAPPVSASTAPVPNNVAPAYTPPTVNYPTFTGDGKDGIRQQLTQAQAALQSLSTLTPGYDTNAKKAQLQNQIDGLNNLLNPKPSYFQMRQLDNATATRPSVDAPANNLVTPGYS